MQPFAKNMAVEYAAKALPDGELAKALKDLQDGKTTIEEVTALIEGGTVSNAKPIYYHPITSWDDNLGSLSFLIIDNNPEAYTKTTLLAKINDFARLAPITGAIKADSSQILIVSYAFKANNNFLAMGVYTNGNIESGQNGISINNFITNAASLSDGVNKLN